MELKEFLETEDEFTKEELETLLYLLDVVKGSLTDSIEGIIKSLDFCELEDLKTTDIEFKKLHYMRKVCCKFYRLIQLNLLF